MTEYLNRKGGAFSGAVHRKAGWLTRRGAELWTTACASTRVVSYEDELSERGERRRFQGRVVEANMHGFIDAEDSLIWYWMPLIVILVAVLATVVWFLVWRFGRLRSLRAGSEIAQTSRGPIEYAQQAARTCDGPLVLVLHGGMGGWDQALLVGQDILGTDSGLRILAPSRVGYLRTPLDTGTTPEECADAMAALMDTLGIEDAAILGVSGGGPTALAMAIRHPSRVRALVMMAAITGTHTQPQLTTNEVMTRLLFSRTASLLLDFATWILFVRLTRLAPRFMVRRMFGATETFDKDRINQRVREVFEHREQWTWMYRLFHCSVPLSVRKVGLDNDLKQFAELGVYPVQQIVCPTLVVHGRHDGNVPFSHAEFVGQNIPGARMFVAETCGHLLWMSDEADAMRHDVLSFLKDHLS